MGLDELEAEILARTQLEVDRIIKQGRQAATETAARARQELADAKLRHAQQLGAEIAKLDEREASILDLELRRIRMTTRKRLVDSLRPRLLAALSGLPAAENQRHLELLLRRAESAFPGGKVRSNRSDEAFVRTKSKLAYDGYADIAGGVVASNADGSVILDLSYDALLDEAWNDIVRTFDEAVNKMK